MTKRYLLALCLISSRFLAQEWTEMMQKPSQNFYSVQAAFNAYWKDKDVTVPGNGYKQFRRWEYFMEPRVYPSGDLSLVSNTWNNFEDFLKKNGGGQNTAGKSASSTWVAVGPMGPMTGLATNGFPRKAGRDNFLTFHPTIANTFWAGCPSGGLWKTTNGGASWTTNTDNLSVIGCSDLAIDPVNTNNMYLATGDGDSGDTYCIGILKSTDGGATWNPSGLTFNVSQQVQMRRIIINPVNPLIVLAACNIGIYRTTNGGTSWTLVNSNGVFDLEFKPGDPTVVYASGTSFYKSTNSGANFSTITGGVPTSGTNRMCIAVTAADPTYVYVLASNAATNGFLGLYRSTNSGAAFTQVSSTPNVLANACAGTGTGGQGWYDLALAVSPTDKNKVDVGGVNVWESNSGGSTGTWTCIGCWIGVNTPTVYLKADHHDLDYDLNGVLNAATDGGIFRYTGSSWTDLNPQRNIAQIYRIGLSSLSPARWITGHQDNGTNIYTGTTYTASLAGDGMDCFIDRTNDQNMFAAQPNGGFNRSTTGGSSWTSITTGLSGGGAWVSPWKQDPVLATRLYAGYSQMFVSNNSGTNWTQLTATGGSGNIVEFAIAPSNNQVIYVIHGTSIRKTTNGGSSWTNVTGTIPVGSGAPTYVTISPTDPLKVWVTLSGYSAGNKVFQTTNGGTSWTNVSANLPNLPANCSFYQVGSNDQIYLGMDVGVYYRNATMSSWTLYNSGLPNVPISDLEISPASPNLLRAATYGRGVYEVDVVSPVTQPAPVNSFATTSLICSGTSATFTDNSTNNPTSWSWSVTPSTGVTINNASSQNPSIGFTSAGNYTVSLTASNGGGSGAPASTVITVQAVPQIALAMNNTVVCMGDNASVQASGASTYVWLPGSGTGSNFQVNTAGAQVTTYTCFATASNGCTNNQAITVEVVECLGAKEILSQDGNYSIFPNPTDKNLNLRTRSGNPAIIHVQVMDVNGKLVLKQELRPGENQREMEINTAGLANGVYTLKIMTEKEKDQAIKFVKH